MSRASAQNNGINDNRRYTYILRIINVQEQLFTLTRTAFKQKTAKMRENIILYTIYARKPMRNGEKMEK